MLVLAFDTAMNACSVSLCDTEKGPMAAQTLPLTQGHAEKLVPMIQSILTESEKKFEALNLIAVTKGPGGFTGMRIGLATAKSFGQALKIPVIGVCTFDAIMQTFHANTPSNQPQNYAILLETKRSDYYMQLFNTEGEAISDKHAQPFDQILEKLPTETIVIGDANQRFQTELQKSGTNRNDLTYRDILSPDPTIIAKIGANLYAQNRQENPPDPVYLRAPDVSTPKKSKRA